MGLHHLELFRRELARFLQDGVGNADLAQVVHGRGQADVLDLFGRPAEDFGEQLAVQSGALDVRAGLFVAIARGAEQAEDGFFVGAADGLHLLADLGLEGGRILPPLDDQIAPLHGLLRLKDQFAGLDRLEQIAVGPQGHRLDGRGGFFQGGQHEDFRIGPALLDLRKDFQARTVGHA